MRANPRPFVLLAVLPGLVAADWPQWLGPTRDGVSRETGVAAAWASNGLREVWRRSPGAGYSSVVVAGGVAYTMTAEGADESVLAVDAATGETRWAARIDDADAWRGYPGPRSTPTVTGDRVVTLSSQGTLVALSARDGHLLWSVDLVAGLGGVAPSWGYAASPLVSGDRVYVGTGAASGSLAAFSLTDGRLVWSSGSYGAAYSSPVRASLGGADQVVFFTAAGPVGVTPDKGALLWQSTWKTSYDVNAATPLVVGPDRLFIASGYGVGGALLQVGGGQAAEVWRTKGMKNKTATSILHEGNIYGFSDDRLTCVDAATGATRWEQDGMAYGSLILVDGHLVVLGGGCSLTLARATPTAFERVAGPTPVLPGSPCWSTPALADGVFYVRNTTQMAAFSTR